MNAARKTAPQTSLRTALVVSANEGHGRVDRLSLQNAKIFISRAVTSARQAKAHLLKHGADVVLVDEKLEDCSGLDFIRMLKAQPGLRGIPVILVSSSSEMEQVLEAIKLGCVGFLVRPYTLDAFFKHLALARQALCFLGDELNAVSDCRELIEEGQAEAAVPELVKVLETPDEARYYYETGLRHLAKQDYTQAIDAFTKASRINKLLAEAYLGLARCWQALGDDVRYRKAMTQAAEICAKRERFEYYKNEFLGILKDDPRNFNPFLSLGMRLAREMDWDGTLMALKNAVWLCPNDAKAHLELARAYHFKREPELAKRSVNQALMLSGHDREAQDLYERWTGRVWGEEEETEEEFLMEDKNLFPEMIPAMLNGVLYLAGVVTEGLHRFRRNYA